MNLSLVGIGVQAPGETKWKQGFCFSFHLANVPIINEFIDRAEDMEALGSPSPQSASQQKTSLDFAWHGRDWQGPVSS
jgi:hypothetical protein